MMNHLSKFKLKYLALSLSVALVAGCNSSSSDTPNTPPSDLTPLPAQFKVSIYEPFEALQTFTEEGTQQLTLTINALTEYAHLSVFIDDQIVLDNVNIPQKGENTINMLLNLPEASAAKTADNGLSRVVKFVARDGDIEVKKIEFTAVDANIPMFKDIAEERGMTTAVTYKYSGPAVADFDNDGDYDFALNNHNFVSTIVVTNNDGDLSDMNPIYGEGTVPDLHGSAWGDYDNDGDLDLMQSVGGANGTSDSSYELLKNNGDGTFTNVSKETGILTPARGRAPRWADFDNDGHLDLLLVNAKTPNSTSPQQLFYRNNGDQTFTAVRVSGLEEIDAERVLMLDYNRDGKEDILLVSSYSPISLWKGNGDFTFTNVSAELLPDSVLNGSNTFGAASVDVDNDGRPDLYLARGLPLYQLSNKSIDYNPLTQSVDFRDKAEKGTTLINFTSEGDIKFSEMDMVYRSTYNGTFPIFLGKNKVRTPIKATGFQENQYPDEMRDAPDSVVISQTGDAEGWPEERTENGLYIGFKDGKWTAETVRDGDLFWNIAFKLDNVATLDYDWEPNNHNRRDILLLNTEEGFVDATEEWNIPLGGNAWGVTSGDFNNNGFNDLFVYRYGYLKERVSDVLLLNTGKGSFQAVTQHGARDPEDKGHGDMGQAFDFDLDGKVDMLNGSDELGKWYLYQNQIENAGHYLLIDVKYSPLKGIDSYGAEVIVTTENGKEYVKRVASAGEVFSQSMLNIMHFGLGDETAIKSVKITWRNGETVTFNDIAADTLYKSNSQDTVSPTPEAITLSRTSKRINTDSTYQIEPIFTPFNAINSVSYTSSDVTIASVDAEGLITSSATKTGTATITITSLERRCNGLF
ncbi:FG-GAP-like repeat-containing protein [Psychromonas sp. MME2]|uniref:FG-GAP-like repeat-containing protein n=1 Tax=Psychromonas sp. MME2 TaxID=3231033 RepID=UPI00339C7AFF